MKRIASPRLTVIVAMAGLAWLPDRAAAQALDTYFTPENSAIGGAEADPSRGKELNRYSAPGVSAGSFVIRPDLSENFGYNSNVEGFSHGRGSAFASTRGSVSATSDWSRDSASVNLTVDDERYLDRPRQSFTNYTANVGGTIDVGRDQIGLRYSHLNLYQTPGGIDAVTVAQPVAFRVDSGVISYKALTNGRVSFEPSLSVTNYDFDDYTIGNTRVSQAYRNRVILQGELTTRYSFAPQRDALLVFRGTNTDYSTGSQNGAPKRNSNGGAVLTGLDYPAPGANIRFLVLAGVQLRSYTSEAYSQLLAPIVEASAIWTPTRLTTVTLSARRDIEDASDDSIAGYTYTAARLSVNHELRRNVTLNAYGEVLQADYQSSKLNIPSIGFAEAGTSQTIYSAGTGAVWLLNRNVRAGLSFGISDRTGSTANGNYFSYISMFTIGFRL